MLHVVSGFQLAGFPHVIGTLWPVGDKTTNDVLEAFMQHLSNGGQDDAAIARALHYAVNTRRISGRQLSKNVIAWAPFIHFGC
jgi:CHAT domain-containing protein